MFSTLNKYATPMITSFFIVSLVSGLALFFHIGGQAWHGIHEWLSIVLILPFALHLWKNWRPMVTYFKRTPIMIAFVVATALSLPFFMVDTQSAAGGPPQFAFAEQVFANNVATLAPALGVAPETVIKRLEGAGFDVSSPNLPLRDIARLSNKNSFQLSAALTFAAP